MFKVMIQRYVSSGLCSSDSVKVNGAADAVTPFVLFAVAVWLSVCVIPFAAGVAAVVGAGVED
jgi:hypothetical protein